MFQKYRKMPKRPSQIWVQKDREITRYIIANLWNIQMTLHSQSHNTDKKSHKHKIKIEHKLEKTSTYAKIQHTKLMFAKQAGIYI